MCKLLEKQNKQKQLRIIIEMKDTVQGYQQKTANTPNLATIHELIDVFYEKTESAKYVCLAKKCQMH